MEEGGAEMGVGGRGEGDWSLRLFPKAAVDLLFISTMCSSANMPMSTSRWCVCVCACVCVCVCVCVRVCVCVVNEMATPYNLV